VAGGNDSVVAMTNLLKYSILDVFTDKPFSGNPAAVAVLPAAFEDKFLQGIARELNQPITSFLIGPVTSNGSATSATYNIRWFTATGHEIELCGHGAFGAAHYLLKSSPSLKTIKFESKSGTLLVRALDEANVEIEFPAAEVHAVEPKLEEKIKIVLRRALRKDDVRLKFAGTGPVGTTFEPYLLMELDEDEELRQLDVDTSAFTDLAPYLVNIVTTSAKKLPNTAFVSRMFAPIREVSEDHVCGSAHCLLGPYWALQLGVTSSDAVMEARQVSKRGGNIDVVWDRERSICRLRGKARLSAEGQLYF